MSTFNAERGCSHVLLDTSVLITISLWLWTSHHLPDFLFPFPMDTMRGSNELNPQFSSVTQLCLTLCDPMDYSTPGLPVHHQLPELTQTHVHHISEGIQLSHPRHPFLLLPVIFPNIQVFSNESSLRQVAKVLELQLQHQSFQWIFRTDFL